MATESARPEYLEYFMQIAIAVRERANCLGSRVGAVLVYGDRVIATGYNGTPENMTNCDKGGCERCANREQYEPGSAYDVCICVHAEQNALLSAARFGTAVEGSVLFTTTRPCFGCTKELLQAHITAVYYLHEWSHPDERLATEYERLQGRFSGGVRKVDMLDPREDWAHGRTPFIPFDAESAEDGDAQ